MKNLLALSLAIVLCGCVSSSSLVTGNARPSMSPDAVKLYSEAPAKYDVIGVVFSESNRVSGAGQKEHMVQRLKLEAAKLGANGLIVTSYKPSPLAVGTMEGKAIFVDSKPAQ